MTPALPLIAALEAGGTKFNLALGTGPDDLRATVRIPTTTPRETMDAVLQWLEQAAREHGTFQAIGVGSFGPVDLDPTSGLYGYITTTPKPSPVLSELLADAKRSPPSELSALR